MRTLASVALVLIIVPLIAGRIFKRVNPTLGFTLTMVGHLVARVAMVIAFVSVSVYAVGQGTLPWILLAILSSILALVSLIFGAVHFYAVRQTFRSDAPVEP